MKDSLIITLKLEPAYQQFFNDLRKCYFPRHFNKIEAHLTVFYSLRVTEDLITDRLKKYLHRPEIILTVNAPRNIGNGVVYPIGSEDLLIFHQSMQQDFRAHLCGKDLGRFMPHITIQNKVSAFKSLQLYNRLSSQFVPFNMLSTGISSWRYAKGHWIHLQDNMFGPV